MGIGNAFRKDRKVSPALVMKIIDTVKKVLSPPKPRFCNDPDCELCRQFRINRERERGGGWLGDTAGWLRDDRPRWEREGR